MNDWLTQIILQRPQDEIDELAEDLVETPEDPMREYRRQEIETLNSR